MRLKIISDQPTAWEFYITEVLHKRSKELKGSINAETSFYLEIYLEMYPEETKFNAKVDNKSLMCCEMITERPWTYQV